MANGNKNLRLISIPLAETSDTPFRETTAAYGIWIEGNREPMTWFPKSQIQDFKIEDEVASFWCPDWLIKEKEVEHFVDTSYEPSLFDEV